METLEIVRLELAKLGIALLPFTYVALLLALLMRVTSGMGGRLRGWEWANVGVWIGLMVMEIVKVVGLAKMGFTGSLGRVGSKYPVSDQVIDGGVMAGVFAVLALLETWLILAAAHNHSKEAEQVKDPEEMDIVGK